LRKRKKIKPFFKFLRLGKTEAEMMYEHHLMEANYAMLEQPLGLDLNLQVQCGPTAGMLEQFLGLAYGIAEIRVPIGG
jgi:hypothetical protein